MLVKAKKTYKEFAEIEYRLCGLFMILNKQEYSLTHLKNALAIDVDSNNILKELFPTVYDDTIVQKTITYFKKLMS